MVEGFAKTPRYFLKDGSDPTSPKVVPPSSGEDIKVIFGFSDKPEYDAFRKASPLALRPYPMVEGFLENQIANDIKSLKLIVVDAASPTQDVLDAATMQSVLASMEKGVDSVAVSHQLILDQSAREYRIEARTDATSETQVP